MHLLKSIKSSLLLILLVLPLMANKSCGEALQEAEKDATISESLPDAETEPATHSDKVLPVLPEDPEEAEEILKSTGPEVTSPYVDE